MDFKDKMRISLKDLFEIGMVESLRIDDNSNNIILFGTSSTKLKCNIKVSLKTKEIFQERIVEQSEVMSRGNIVYLNPGDNQSLRFYFNDYQDLEPIFNSNYSKPKELLILIEELMTNNVSQNQIISFLPKKTKNIYPKNENNIHSLFEYYLADKDLSYDGAANVLMNKGSLTLNQIEYIVKNISNAFDSIFRPNLKGEIKLTNHIQYALGAILYEGDSKGSQVRQRITQEFLNFLKHSNSK